MKYIFVIAGPAGAGKSTISYQLAKKYNAVRYSFDELHCFRHSDLIAPVIKSIKKGNSIVIDALYSKRKFREELLQATKDINYRRILVYMNTPLEECIRRNAQRSNPLPEFMIRDIYNLFEIPTLDECWDDIWHFK